MRKYTGHNETWLTNEMNRALQAKTHLKRLVNGFIEVIAIYVMQPTLSKYHKSILA